MTVLPHGIGFARRIHFSGRQWDTVANAPGCMMEAHSSDDICFAPACAAIGGGEGQHEKIDTCKAVDRFNHGPVGLHEGLPTDAMRIVGGRQSSSPGLSAISGGAHLDQVA